MIYPVGSFYETTNPNFDPNIYFVGKWEQSTTGLLTVGAYTDNTGTTTTITNDSEIQVTGGEVSGGTGYTYIEEVNLPEHRHSFSATTSNKSLTGNANFRTIDISDDNLILNSSGIFNDKKNTWAGQHNAMVTESKNNGKQNMLTIDASHTHTVSGNTDYVGSGEKLDITPPVIGVYRWHRILNIGFGEIKNKFEQGCLDNPDLVMPDNYYISYNYRLDTPTTWYFTLQNSDRYIVADGYVNKVTGEVEVNVLG